MLHTNFPIFVYRKRRILLKYKFEKKNSKTTKNLELEKKISPMIYDNTINELLFFQLLYKSLLMLLLYAQKILWKIIENNIAEQIIKLENYILNQTQITNRRKNLNRLLMDLIYNLLENESVLLIIYPFVFFVV